MMTKDVLSNVQCMNASLPVKLRIFMSDGKYDVLAIHVGDNGHLLNRNSTWLATFAANSLGIPRIDRFFVRGSDCLTEHKFKWIGKIAIETVKVSVVSVTDELPEFAKDEHDIN